MLYLLNNGSAIKKYDGVFAWFPFTAREMILFMLPTASTVDHVRGYDVKDSRGYKQIYVTYDNKDSAIKIH